MGTDKALIRFEGEPLARRVADVLAQVAGRVIVASGDGDRLGWLGLEQVADPIPDAGPLAGLVAGLERADTPLVAVAAVDMPFASARLLRVLADRWDGEAAVVPSSARGREPLHAVYAAKAAPPLRTALERGERSVVRALSALRVLELPPAEWRHADPEGAFARNLNRPQDVP
jgi:molybdopterin-guanine dinucleotide biosynthesis protein A